MRRLIALVAVAAALVPGAAQAATPTLVVYRCVAPDGAVSLQNDRPCAKGSRQERRVVELPVEPPSTTVVVSRAPATTAVPASTVASPASPAAVPASTPVATGANVVDPAPRLPAPPLFACRTWDDRRYFGDEPTPPRCAPLTTVGLDRRTPTEVSACEMRVDTCEPVAEATRCEAWRDRRRAAEGMLGFGVGEEAEAARREIERIDATINGTVCAG